MEGSPIVAGLYASERYHLTVDNHNALAAALEAFYQQVTAKAASRRWPVISREVFWRLLYGERDSIPRL